MTDPTPGNGISPASALVAVVLLVMIGAIFIAAILRYPTPAEALQIITGLSGIVGVITGAFVSYFFTRGTVKAATDTAAHATKVAQAAETDQRALRDVVAHLEPPKIDDLVQKSESLRRALER